MSFNIPRLFFNYQYELNNYRRRTSFKRHSEGKRYIIKGKESSHYEIAYMPFNHSYYIDYNLHSKTNWSGTVQHRGPFPTRQAALDHFIVAATNFFTKIVNPHPKTKIRHAQRILEELSGSGLLGFQEPDPVSNKPKTKPEARKVLKPTLAELEADPRTPRTLIEQKRKFERARSTKSDGQGSLF